jgi:4a-hydroxytetrahydrobiopterin dehydratase
MAVLTDDAILQALTSMYQWGYESGELSRRFRFKNFDDAFGFVQEAASLQKEMNHYGTVTHAGPIVTIDLRTEQEGGVTERDLEMARSLSDRAHAANAM